MKLYISNNSVFVWDANDADSLRRKHHIVGSLIGCYPHKPFQNLYKFLPLKLMPEEATLLVEKNIAELYLSPDEVPDDATVHSYFEKRDQLCEEQILLMKENRQKTILEKANEIYEGKKRKYMEMLTGEKSKKNEDAVQEHDTEKDFNIGNPMSSDNDCDTNDKGITMEGELLNTTDNPENTKESQEKTTEQPEVSSYDESHVQEVNLPEIDKDKIIQQELSKVPTLKKDLCMVQLFTECSWKMTSEIKETNWKFPSTMLEKLRYAVYKDLWEKGYYMTVGTKFGGDFLVYEGDPLKFHALFIVICLPYSKNFQAIDIVRYGRLGNQVKKTAVLASLNGNSVEYISLKWNHKIY